MSAGWLAGIGRAAKEVRQLRGGGVAHQKTPVRFDDWNAAQALGTDDVAHGTEPYRVSPSPVLQLLYHGIEVQPGFILQPEEPERAPRLQLRGERPRQALVSLRDGSTRLEPVHPHGRVAHAGEDL